MGVPLRKTGKIGQSLFAPLKLRSLALVPSSGALPRLRDFHSNMPRRRDSSCFPHIFNLLTKTALTAS